MIYLARIFLTLFLFFAFFSINVGGNAFLTAGIVLLGLAALLAYGCALKEQR